LDRLQNQLQPMMSGDSAWQLVRSNNTKDLWRVQLNCDDQADVDASVDVVRGLDGSVVTLQPHRHTLEDTFMRLVQQSGSPVPATTSAS
ncbi:MAG: ABC transporter ATP-binding protein, partial [Rhodopirellula bahusiensis]